MSKLEDLIAELCPNGVEYKKISDIYSRIKGTPITASKMKKIASEDGEVRIFAGGKTVINAHESDIPKANITRVPAVLVQSRGVIDAVYYDKPFTFKNEMWAYTSDSQISVKFLYYILKNNIQYFRDAASGMGSLPQISLHVTEDFEIPVPPLEVQAEIVRILDTFTELTAELTARSKQYEYYRDTLLTFNDNNPLHSLISSYCPNGVEYYKTSDLVRMSFWLMPATPRFIEDGIPYITSKNVKNGVINFESAKYIDCEDFAEISKNRPICEGDMLITMIGTIGEVAIVKGNTKFYGQNLYLLRFDKTKIITKYYYYFITSEKIRNSIISRKNPSSQGYIKAGNIENLQIPVPPLEVQHQIVQILDRFDSLCNDLTKGLPAEIEARRKQYEYYRDQLLNFKRA